MADQLKAGDRVRHVGSPTNPVYADRLGVGRVLSVRPTGVQVLWEGVPERPRNYKSLKLRKVEN